MHFIQYNNIDGRIKIFGIGSIIPNMNSSTSLMKVKSKIDSTAKYVNLSTLEIIDRPLMNIVWNKTTILNDGVDTASCNLESGCRVVVLIPNVYKQIIETDGTPFELTSTIESDHIVTIDKFPYQQYVQIIEVTK